MSNLGQIAIARYRFHGNEVYHRKMLTDMTQIDFFALRVIKCNFLPAYINIGQTFVYWYSLMEIASDIELVQFYQDLSQCLDSNFHAVRLRL